MMARVEERSGETLLVTLSHHGQSVNDEMISQGLVRIDKDFPKRHSPLVSKLKEKETAARTGRQGLWRYGDIDEDDDLEFGTRRQQMQAAQAATGAAPNAWGKK